MKTASEKKLFVNVGLTILSFRRRKKRTRTFRKFFATAIAKHFPDESNSLVAEVDRRFELLSADTAFATTSRNPIDKRLDFAAYFLALIQTLEAKGLSYAEIKNICLEVTYDFVSPRNAVHAWLKRWPSKVIGSPFLKPLIDVFNNKVSKLGHPDGFRADIITDKKETYNLGYGIEIRECGICKLFQKHEAFRYASILCEVDKVTSSLAGLELIRTGTIANGAEKCDFRFRRIGDKRVL
jgi:hypothetical protein